MDQSKYLSERKMDQKLRPIYVPWNIVRNLTFHGFSPIVGKIEYPFVIIIKVKNNTWIVPLTSMTSEKSRLIACTGW